LVPAHHVMATTTLFVELNEIWNYQVTLN
jgi:hypothetical protein